MDDLEETGLTEKEEEGTKPCCPDAFLEGHSAADRFTQHAPFDRDDTQRHIRTDYQIRAMLTSEDIRLCNRVS